MFGVKFLGMLTQAQFNDFKKIVVAIQEYGERGLVLGQVVDYFRDCFLIAWLIYGGVDIEECSARGQVGGDEIVKGGDDIVKGGVDFHVHANVGGLAGVVVTFGVKCR